MREREEKKERDRQTERKTDIHRVTDSEARLHRKRHLRCEELVVRQQAQQEERQLRQMIKFLSIDPVLIK